MNSVALKSSKDPRLAIWFPLLLGLAVVATAFSAKFFLEHGLTWRCPSIVLFGVPCPGCGGTRALAALAEGEIIRALRFNPLLVAGLFVSLALPFLKIQWTKRSDLGWPVFAVLIGLNWIYLFFFLPR